MKISEFRTKLIFGVKNLYSDDNGRQADQNGEGKIKDGVVIGSDFRQLADALPLKEVQEDVEAETQPEEELASDEASTDEDNIKPERPGRLPRIEHYFTALRSVKRSPRTVAEYRYENRWWERQAAAKGLRLYSMRVADIEACVADLHPSTARRKIAFLKNLSEMLHLIQLEADQVSNACRGDGNTIDDLRLVLEFAGGSQSGLVENSPGAIVAVGPVRVRDCDAVVGDDWINHATVIVHCEFNYHPAKHPFF